MNKTKIFTLLAFLVLLTIRFPIGDFVANLSGFFNVTAPLNLADTSRLIQDQTHYLWDNLSFLLVGIVILANRNNLDKLKIDGNFIALFSGSGLVFYKYYFGPLGWAGGLLSSYIAYLLLRNRFDFANDSRPNYRTMIVILTTAFFLHRLVSIGTLNGALMYRILYALPTVPFLLVEEVIFRGLLWMYLEELGVPGIVIVIIQTFLFWSSHIYYMFSNPFLFWFEVPVASFLLGIIVWKYKSLTPSSVGHILFNLR